MRLKGRTVIVTGAGGGIGRSISTRLAAEGAHLALFDPADAVEETASMARDSGAAAGVQVRTTRVDVGDPAQVNEAVAATLAQFGAIDGLVNNAGITANLAPLTKMADDAWARELAVNLSGPFYLARAVLPGMVERGWGRIVNISSVAARGGLYRQAGYSATKSGLLGLTRNIVLEYAEYGITCNAVLPGLIETPTVARMPQTIKDFALSMTPARRLGRTEEIAAVVAFLCSEESAYLNGAEIDVDGGGRLSPMVLGSVREVEARRNFHS